MTLGLKIDPLTTQIDWIVDHPNGWFINNRCLKLLSTHNEKKEEKRA